MSDKTPVYIKDVLVKDFKCFQGENLFSFVDDEGNWCRWTVFLGDNNTGKTNLLKAIASLEPYDRLSDDNERTYFPLGSRENTVSDKAAVLGLNICPDRKEQIYSKPDFLESLEDKSFDGLMYSATFVIGHSNILLKELFIYGYGVTRNIEPKGIATIQQSTLNAANLFYDTKLINFEDWLFQLDWAAKSNNKQAASRLELVKKLLKSDIFPEIKDIQFVSDENINNYIEFQTENGWHKLSELGYGYRATLSWMCDFCKKMFERYPESANPLKEPAVLLIDEIDLHLHPQWQRNIIRYLSDIFSATQFIVTTHSPFIIQSMECVNLYTLQREGDHTNVKHWGNRSFIGWKIEEILSDVMGLEDNVYTDTYQDLMKKFDNALDTDDYEKGRGAFEALKKILHPESVQRKLLDIQFSQLVPEKQND